MALLRQVLLLFFVFMLSFALSPINFPTEKRVKSSGDAETAANIGDTVTSGTGTSDQSKLEGNVSLPLVNSTEVGWDDNGNKNETKEFNAKALNSSDDTSYAGSCAILCRVFWFFGLTLMLVFVALLMILPIPLYRHFKGRTYVGE